MGDSGPPLLPLVVGLELESRDGVEEEPDDEPKMGLTRGRFLFGASSSVSWCNARRRLPKGEFFKPAIG